MSSIFDLDRLIEDQKKYNASLDNALAQTRKVPPAAENNLFAQYGICLCECKTLQLPSEKGVADASLLWTKKELTKDGCITVGFLDGLKQDHAVVKKKVMEWLQYPDKIGMDFKFVDPSDRNGTNRAHVRISFKRNNQSFSYVGIQCLRIPEGHETMHLGWDVSTDYGQATVLHEFGHALGLFHEHQSPFGAQTKIHWVEDVVIEDCKRYLNWGPEKTRAQIINVEPITRSTIGTVYDPLSIMHYRFPPQWTEEGYDRPVNLTLSSLDKTFIRRCYPPQRDRTQTPEDQLQKDLMNPDKMGYNPFGPPPGVQSFSSPGLDKIGFLHRITMLS